jgi:hypothetical protein
MVKVPDPPENLPPAYAFALQLYSCAGRSSGCRLSSEIEARRPRASSQLSA